MPRLLALLFVLFAMPAPTPTPEGMTPVPATPGTATPQATSAGHPFLRDSESQTVSRTYASRDVVEAMFATPMVQPAGDDLLVFVVVIDDFQTATEATENFDKREENILEPWLNPVRESNPNPTILDAPDLADRTIAQQTTRATGAGSNPELNMTLTGVSTLQDSRIITFMIATNPDAPVDLDIATDYFAEVEDIESMDMREARENNQGQGSGGWFDVLPTPENFDALDHTVIVEDRFRWSGPVY